MSFLGGLLSFIPGVGPLLGMGADALGAMGKSSAQNRGAAIDTALAGQQVANQTNQQNLNDRQSAWKNLLNADYTMNNNQGYTPATLHSSVPGMGDRVLPSFGTARNPYGAGVMSGAAGMQNEALRRLQGGPQLQMPDVNRMAKPSMWEKIINIAAPIMKGASGLKFGGSGDDADESANTYGG